MKEKNVVMLVYNYFENDSRVLKEANSLSKNGYKVILYALWKEGLAREEKINDFLVKRIEIKPIHKKILRKSGFKWLKGLVFGERQILKPDVVQKVPDSDKKISFDRKKMSKLKFLFSVVNKAFSYQSFYSGVQKDIIKNNFVFDFIHNHDMSTLQLAYKLNQKYKKPFIYDSHELFIERDKPYVTPNWYKFLQKKFEKKRIKKANGVITVSNSIANEFVRRYKINYPTLIYNTPYFTETTQSISIREKLQLTEDIKIVMYSGGFTIGRGLEKLVEALKFVPSNYHFVFLGFGKPSFVTKLNSIAQLAGVTDRFTIYGPVQSHEVPLYLSSANLCISPIQNVALNNYFSCPNKVFEYIQARVPMALSNFPELQRIIDEEKIGVTFNPEKPENIANSIIQFLENKEEYQKAQKNIEKSAIKYNWENEEKKLLALYNQITHP